MLSTASWLKKHDSKELLASLGIGETRTPSISFDDELLLEAAQNSLNFLLVFELKTGVILAANNTLKAKLGYDISASKTLKINQIEPFLSVNRRGKRYDALKQGVVSELEETVFLSKRGVNFYVEASFTVLPSDSNLVMVSAREISRRRELQKELIKTTNAAREYNYIVSHNLRAPISNIKALSDLLVKQREKLTEQDRMEVADNLYETVKQLDDTLHDVSVALSLQRQNIEMEKVEFSETVEQVLEMIEDQASLLDAEFEVDIEPKKIRFSTVKTYLHSVLGNLVSNAVKYHHPKRQPKIKIKARLQGWILYFEVVDNGIGIDLKQYGVQMFGFYKKFNHDFEGKGMGLHLTKTQVEALGGRIEVESVLGEGSKFKVAIPVFE